MDEEKHVNDASAAYTTMADQIVSKPVILELGGKPVLVLVPYDEYQRLRRIEKDAQVHQAAVSAPTRPKRNTLKKALGLLATSGPAPSEAEVEQWLHEHRLEKYG
jgi:hypothetical protein